MKLTAIALLKWNGDKEPVLFGVGADLSSFGFFQRGSVKEMLTFVARTVAKRTLIGQRQTVQNEEYYCHAFNRDGLVRVISLPYEKQMEESLSRVPLCLEPEQATCELLRNVWGNTIVHRWSIPHVCVLYILLALFGC